MSSYAVQAVDGAGLLEASGGHPAIHYDTGCALITPAFVASGPGGAALGYRRRSSSGVPGLSFLGPAPGIAAVLDDDLARHTLTDDRPRHVSADPTVFAAVAARLPVTQTGNDWEWMWTTEAPAVPTRGFAVLDESWRERLVAFLAEHSPRTHGAPFERPEQSWVALLDADGALSSTGCSEPSAAGVPLLSGIATAASARGRGLAGAITAYLSADAVRRAGVCTLGLYADNDAARRIYLRLGYRSGATWRTRTVDW